MGAWGTGSFENDDAMDWLPKLTAAFADAELREALAPVAAIGDGYLEAPVCSIAIAAAEAVAAARGQAAASLPEEVANWAQKRPKVTDDVLALARLAVDRIARSSELLDLWTESDSAAEWRTTMADLRKRLR